MDIFMWVFLFLALLLVPGVMLVFGRIFQKDPPGEINSGYGYRTTRSMRNKDTWLFAHRYCGRLWSRAGMSLLVVTVLAFCLCIGKEVDVVSDWGLALLGIQLVVMLATIPIVERALKKNFDEYGRRK